MGDLGSIPGLGRSPGEVKGYPLQYSGLGNSMDCVVHGVTKGQTRLSDLTSGVREVGDREGMGGCERARSISFFPPSSEVGLVSSVVLASGISRAIQLYICILFQISPF